LRLRSHRFSRKETQRLVDTVVIILKKSEPTPFARSASSVYGLRQNLCLSGWPWLLAHLTAAAIVARALAQIGARFPSWIEGQPSYTKLGFYLRPDEFCWECGDMLPKFKKRFCSPDCVKRWHKRDLL
jgi:hypothetical protein